MLAVRKPKQTPQSRKQTNAPDGCSTDPESNIELAKGQLSNMRSKCRCSCVLQFTFRRAVSCVLHRPPSQVIHCTVLCFKHCSASAPGFPFKKQLTSHLRGGQPTNSSLVKALWRRTLSSSATLHQGRLEPPASRGNRVSLRRTWCEQAQADRPAPWASSPRSSQA